MAEPWLDVREFDRIGLPRDGIADWSEVLQAAIDAALDPRRRPAVPRFPPPGGRPRPGRVTLYLPPGFYRITKPLLVLRRTAERDRYEPCSLSLVGEAASTDGVLHASTIVTDFGPLVSWPALILQGVRGVRIERLTLRGQNPWVAQWSGADAETHLWRELRGEDPYLYRADPRLPSRVRNHPASPHAGICIDPFHPGVPAAADPADDPRYPAVPGLPLHLQGSLYLPGPASREVVLHDCVIRDFAVGVCVAPCGLDLEDEPFGELGLTLSNTYCTSNKTGLSVSGRRQVVLDGSGVGENEISFNCVDYGGTEGRPGRCPSISGANLGLARYLFKTANTGADVSISGVYMESTMSLGQLGAPLPVGETPDRYVFSGCGFNFIHPDERTKAVDNPDPMKDDPVLIDAPLPSMNAHLINFAHTTFLGCTFAPGQKADGAAPAPPPPPIHLINGDEGSLAFIGCNLGGGRSSQAPDLGPTFWVSGHPERVSYVNCTVRDVLYNDKGNRFPAPVVLSDMSAVESLNNTLQTPYIGQVAMPGSFFFPLLLREESELERRDEDAVASSLRVVAGQLPIIPVRPAAGADRFAAGALQILQRPEKIGGVTRDIPTGQATLLVEAGTLVLGDLLTTPQGRFPDVLLYNPLPGFFGAGPDLRGPLLLGRVIKVVAAAMGQEQVTLDYVPIGLAVGLTEETEIILAHLPRIHPPTKGDVGLVAAREIRQLSIKIDVASKGIAWGREQRIFGIGVAMGAYVTDFDFASNKIIMSKGREVPAADATLFDALVLAIEASKI